MISKETFEFNLKTLKTNFGGTTALEDLIIFLGEDYLERARKEREQHDIQYSYMGIDLYTTLKAYCHAHDVSKEDETVIKGFIRYLVKIGNE